MSVSYDDENATINVSLTDEENDELYTMPLTVKVYIPGIWATATANGEKLAIRKDEGGNSYVLVDVAPETTVAVIGG